MASLAISVVGHDRPGLIADVTNAIAGRAGNLEDSSMTLLRGHFAWTLVVATDASAEELSTDLEFLNGEDLVVSVLPLPESDADSVARPLDYVLRVHGADRVGIVAAMTGALAKQGGNITDLQTRLGQGLYVLIAEVEFPADADIVGLQDHLHMVALELGVECSFRPADPDVL